MELLTSLIVHDLEKTTCDIQREHRDAGDLQLEIGTREQGLPLDKRDAGCHDCASNSFQITVLADNMR